MSTRQEPSREATDAPAPEPAPYRPGSSAPSDARDDGPLDSIGKAITDSVTSAAADEEPDERGLPAVKPGG